MSEPETQAADADPGGHYIRGDARRLPFADASIDLVVAFNSLMDIEDMPVAVREAARVLRRDGRFCFSVTHPIADAGTGPVSEPLELTLVPYHAPSRVIGRHPHDQVNEREIERRATGLPAGGTSTCGERARGATGGSWLG